jgi:hypothetical protein
VTTCSSCSSAVWTTSSTVPASPVPVATPASSSYARPLPGQRQEGRHPVVPGHQYDIIDVREKSLEMTPFIVARETHGERIVPAWMEAVPNRMRILVHPCPSRADRHAHPRATHRRVLLQEVNPRPSGEPSKPTANLRFESVK